MSHCGFLACFLCGLLDGFHADNAVFVFVILVVTLGLIFVDVVLVVVVDGKGETPAELRAVVEECGSHQDRPSDSTASS